MWRGLPHLLPELRSVRPAGPKQRVPMTSSAEGPECRSIARRRKMRRNTRSTNCARLEGPIIARPFSAIMIASEWRLIGEAKPTKDLPEIRSKELLRYPAGPVLLFAQHFRPEKAASIGETREQDEQSKACEPRYEDDALPPPAKDDLALPRVLRRNGPLLPGSRISHSTSSHRSLNRPWRAKRIRRVKSSCFTCTSET